MESACLHIATFHLQGGSDGAQGMCATVGVVDVFYLEKDIFVLAFAIQHVCLVVCGAFHAIAYNNISPALSDAVEPPGYRVVITVVFKGRERELIFLACPENRIAQ